MTALFVVGTYLMIGSFVSLLCWWKRNKDAWFGDDSAMDRVLFLYLMVTWPKFFVVFVRVLRKKLAERRANSRRIVIHSGGKTFHIVPAEKD